MTEQMPALPQRVLNEVVTRGMRDPCYSGDLVTIHDSPSKFKNRYWIAVTTELVGV